MAVLTVGCTCHGCTYCGLYLPWLYSLQADKAAAAAAAAHAAAGGAGSTGLLSGGGGGAGGGGAGGGPGPLAQARVGAPGMPQPPSY